MRKQYYFRPSDPGYMAWDVDRLVESTRDHEVIRVPLAKIAELDENFWYQGEADVPTVRSIAEHCQLILETDLLHPIILSAEGRVMDGMHRVARALMLRHTEIRAVKFDVDPPPDYIHVFPDDLSY